MQQSRNTFCEVHVAQKALLLHPDFEDVGPNKKSKIVLDIVSSV